MSVSAILFNVMSTIVRKMTSLIPNWLRGKTLAYTRSGKPLRSRGKGPGISDCSLTLVATQTVIEQLASVQSIYTTK